MKMLSNHNAFTGDIDKYYSIEFGGKRPGFYAKLDFWVNHFGFHCVAAYRFGQFATRLYKKNFFLGFIPKALSGFLSFIIRMIYHVEISAVTIGPGFYIGHLGSIYIGGVSIGKNFSVTHNVTVGLGHSFGKEGRPIIGDNVWIGTGSTVAGAITIGNNVTIMPGTFLSRAIPDGCLIGGNPARVLAQNYDNTKLFMGNGDPPPVIFEH